MNKKIFVSVIIPVYNAEKTVGDCLRSVYISDYVNFEVIVVDDNSTDSSLKIIREFPCSVIEMKENSGAAAARNKGSKLSRGEILFFLDSDIIIQKNTIGQIVETFEQKPEIGALFCSYQKETVPDNFYSEYKNFLHHYTHQTSREDAATFCGGFGAMQRNVFYEFSGFDESYRNLEDIELGYRLYKAGYKIFLNKNIQVIHCKEYTFWGLIKSDLLNRAIPWTQAMLEKRVFRSDLNTRINNVLSVPIAFLMLLNIPLIYFLPRSVYVFILLLAFLLALNKNFYLFVLREKGPSFTVKTILMNWLSYIYSGVGAVVGFLVYLKVAHLESSSN